MLIAERDELAEATTNAGAADGDEPGVTRTRFRSTRRHTPSST